MSKAIAAASICSGTAINQPMEATEEEGSVAFFLFNRCKFQIPMVFQCVNALLPLQQLC